MVRLRQRKAQALPRWPAIASRAIDFAKKQPLGALGAVIFLILVLLAIAAPAVSPFDPYDFRGKYKYSGPGTVVTETGETFWLGADQLGRDVLSRLIHGARLSVYVSVMSVAIGVTAGSLIGVVSAYFGGLVDLAVQRVIDTLMSFPPIILALAIVAIAGTSLNNVIVALVAIFIPGAARVVRAQALSVKHTDYVLCASVVGSGPWRIIFRHMLPNCMAPYIVFATANLGYAVVVEAALSFLGVGAPHDAPSWGGMLAIAGQRYIEVSPWLVVFPSLAICLVVFSFNFLGDALRDTLDPRLRNV